MTSTATAESPAHAADEAEPEIMSDTLTFELKTLLDANELRDELSVRWRGEFIEVHKAVSAGMRWLAIFGYHSLSSEDPRPTQDNELTDAIQFLVSVSLDEYIYYYRSSETVERATLASRVLEPSDVLGDHHPCLISGDQKKFVLVRDRDAVTALPPVWAAGRWRLGCRAEASVAGVVRKLRLSCGRDRRIELIERGRAGELLIDLREREHSVFPSKAILEATRVLGQVSSKNRLYYYPLSVSLREVVDVEKTMEVEDLFEDEIRFALERAGPYRYLLRRPPRPRSWSSDH